ncbi:hypothetical protein M758_9G018600 [Ceratodon purpureus]|nr:hypothetical protein M758_9G018600 [Ceratodon purpureus]
MASHCHCLSVNTSAFRVSASYGCSASSSASCNLGVAQGNVKQARKANISTKMSHNREYKLRDSFRAPELCGRVVVAQVTEDLFGNRDNPNAAINVLIEWLHDQKSE